MEKLYKVTIGVIVREPRDEYHEWKNERQAAVNALGYLQDLIDNEMYSQDEYDQRAIRIEPIPMSEIIQSHSRLLGEGA